MKYGFLILALLISSLFAVQAVQAFADDPKKRLWMN